MKPLRFLLVLGMLLCCGNISNAARVSFAFTNSVGDPDTNSFTVTPIENYVSASGGFITKGRPIRLTPYSDGKITNTFALGNYVVSNRFVEQGFLIRVPDDSSDTLYNATLDSANGGLALSGFNRFVTATMVVQTNVVGALTNNHSTAVTLATNLTVSGHAFVNGTLGMQAARITNTATANTDALLLFVNSGSPQVSVSQNYYLNASGQIEGPGASLSGLNASALATGTLPDAVFPATLPVASGANLTSLNPASLSGTVSSAYSNALGQSLSAPLHRVFNIMDYGAIPDDGNSDVVAIQAAIEAAGSAGGGTVYLPNGVWDIGTEFGKPGYLAEGLNSSLSIASNNVWMVGESWNALLKWPGGTFPSTRNFIGAVGVTNIGLKNFALDAQFTTESHDLTQIHDSRQVFFENLYFKNSYANEALDTDGCFGVFVNDCVLEYNGGGAIGFGGPGGACGDYFINNILVRGGGTNDSGQVPDSAAINCKATTGIIYVNNVTVDYAPVLLTIQGEAKNVVSNFKGRTSGANNTNIFHQGGPMTIENMDLFSTNAGGVFIEGGNYLSINNSVFNGKSLLWLNQKTGFELNHCRLGTGLGAHSIQINGGGYHKIIGNTFDTTGYSAIRMQSTAPTTNSIFANNTFNECNLHFDGGSSNNIASGNIFRSGNLAVWGSSKFNRFADNYFTSGSVVVGNGSGPNYVDGGTLATIDWQYAQGWVWKDIIWTGSASGGSAANAINASVWENIRAQDLTKYRSWQVTTNYTADSLDTDRVLVCNGTDLVLTLTSAATLNKGQVFRIKNINASSLTVTNATGAELFDGATSMTLSQYDSRTVVSEGSHWRLIGVNP